MVTTVRLEINRAVLRAAINWLDALPQVLYRYFRRRRGVIPSRYRSLYGIELQMVASVLVALLPGAASRHSIIESLDESGTRAVQVARAATPRNVKQRAVTFNVGDESCSPMARLSIWSKRGQRSVCSVLGLG